MFTTVDQVKTIISNFLTKTGRGGFITGTVSSISPLKIRINARLEITEDNLYISDNCIGISINSDTTIRDPLTVGDAVILITRPSTIDGTKYILFDKIKPYVSNKDNKLLEPSIISGDLQISGNLNVGNSLNLNGIPIANKCGFVKAVRTANQVVPAATTVPWAFQSLPINSSNGMVTLNADGSLNIDKRVKFLMVTYHINAVTNTYPTVYDWGPTQNYPFSADAVKQTRTVAFANPVETNDGTFKLLVHATNGVTIVADAYWNYCCITTFY